LDLCKLNGSPHRSGQVVSLCATKTMALSQPLRDLGEEKEDEKGRLSWQASAHTHHRGCARSLARQAAGRTHSHLTTHSAPDPAARTPPRRDAEQRKEYRETKKQKQNQKERFQKFTGPLHTTTTKKTKTAALRLDVQSQLNQHGSRLKARRKPPMRVERAIRGDRG